jgi:hypothetical protein
LRLLLPPARPAPSPCCREPCGSHARLAAAPCPCLRQGLPLSVDLEALRPPGPDGAAAKLKLPQGPACAAAATRADVHGELGVLLVCLDWPGTREALQRSPALRAPPRLLAPPGGATPPGGAPRRRPRRGGGPSAAHRWELVRLLVRFRAARRRQLLEAWWGAAAGAVKAAEAAARVAEIAAWRTLGQAVQVRGWEGDAGPRRPTRAARPAASGGARCAAALGWALPWLPGHRQGGKQALLPCCVASCPWLALDLDPDTPTP